MKNNPLCKKDTAEEIELVSGERAMYYPYLNLPPEVPGEGRAIGELKSGEQVLQFTGISREMAEYIVNSHKSMRDSPPTDQSPNNIPPD